MDISRWLEFPVLKDERGSLIAWEEHNHIPFKIRRVYSLLQTRSGVSRGYHAHRKLKQVIVALSGKCRITLDNGIHREDAILSSPSRGLLIEGLIWREIHDFSLDCVLIVFASELFEEEDYIRDYDSFLRLVRAGNKSR